MLSTTTRKRALACAVLACAIVFGGVEHRAVSATFIRSYQVMMRSAGTGAIDRTAQDKANDTVSVKDFGAKGDGVTDDTAAIAQAILVGGGKTIEFPSPAVSYKVTGTIPVATPGTTLHGNGSKIFVAFGPGTPSSGILFDVTASDTTFDGLWFDSTATTDETATLNHYIIHFTGSSTTHLVNSVVKNSKFTRLPWHTDCGHVTAGQCDGGPPGVGSPLATHAVYAKWADKTVVADNVLDYIGGAAIFTTQLDGLLVSHNRINDTAWYSVQLQALVTGARIESNRITGTRLGGRIWGGSINLMSCGACVAGVGEGNGRNSRVDIIGNYISGVHSYTGAVHIESSSYVTFEDNTEENITLSPGSPFYPDGSSPVYVRPYTRAVDLGGGTWVDEGPPDHIFIRNNRLIAKGTNAIAIYVDNQHKPGVSTRADTVSIEGNKLLSPTPSDTFKNGIAVHGADGGWSNVLIVNNQVVGTPTDATPVSGFIGILANTGIPVNDVLILGNSVEYVGTPPTTSTQLGIGIGANVDRATVANNSVRNFFYGVRLFTGSTNSTVGSNSFRSSAGADYLYSAGPTVATAPSTRYGSLFLTGRASDLTPSTVVSTVAAGEYRICATARTTTSGTGTTATLALVWTDEGGAKTDSVGTFALNSLTATGQVNKCDFVHAAASTNIQVSVTGTYGTSQYAISATAEKLN